MGGYPNFFLTPIFFLTINSVQNFKTVAQPLLGEKFVMGAWLVGGWWVDGWVGGVNQFQCWALTKLNNYRIIQISICENHTIQHIGVCLSFEDWYPGELLCHLNYDAGPQWFWKCNRTSFFENGRQNQIFFKCNQNTLLYMDQTLYLDQL